MRHNYWFGIALLALATTSCGGAATKGVVSGTILSGEINFAGKYGDKPIAQATVQLKQMDKVVADTLSDENGRFRFENLPRGGFDLQIEKGEQFASYSYQEEFSKLLDAADVSLFVNGRCFLKLFMKARQTVLRGKVVAAETGAPVEGADISTYPETVQTKTDEQGGYELTSDSFEEKVKYAVIVTHNEYDNDMTPPMEVKLARENEVPAIKLRARVLEQAVGEGTVEHTPGEDKTTQGEK